MFLSLCLTPHVSEVEMHRKVLSVAQSIRSLITRFSNKDLRLVYELLSR